jgi:hypothetical protein
MADYSSAPEKRKDQTASVLLGPRQLATLCINYCWWNFFHPAENLGVALCTDDYLSKPDLFMAGVFLPHSEALRYLVQRTGDCLEML